MCFDIEPGKRLIVKYHTGENPNRTETRAHLFRTKRGPSEVRVRDRSLQWDRPAARKADSANPQPWGFHFPGWLPVCLSVSGMR